MDDLIAHHRAMLERLLAAPKLPMSALTSRDVPETGGVYHIVLVEGDRQAPFYAGKTRNLRTRVLRNHLEGHQDRSILLRKMIRSGQSADEPLAKMFLKSNCLVQFLVIDDERERAWFEHFAIALLQPKYND